jgi:hypothetical protein
MTVPRVPAWVRGHEAPTAAAPYDDAVWRRLLLSLVLASGLGAIAYGFSIAETDDGTADELPPAIESISPRRRDQVQRQTDIIVDLAPGYDGTLVVNSTEIPPDQLSFDLGQFQLIFPCRLTDSDATPSAGPPATQIASPSGSGQVRPPQPPCARNVEGAELVAMPKGAVTVTVVYWRIATGRQGADSYTWTFSTF